MKKNILLLFSLITIITGNLFAQNKQLTTGYYYFKDREFVADSFRYYFEQGESWEDVYGKDLSNHIVENHISKDIFFPDSLPENPLKYEYSASATSKYRFRNSPRHFEYEAYRYFITRDSNHNIIEEIIQYHPWETWQNKERRTFEINQQKQIVQLEKYQWAGNKWSKTENFKSEYNNKNQLIKYAVLDPHGNELSKKVYEYDHKDRFVKETHSIKNGSAWENGKKIEREYNALDHLLSSTEFEWSKHENKWLPKYKDLYEYDTLGKLIKRDKKTFINNNWEQNWESIYYEYNSTGQLTEYSLPYAIKFSFKYNAQGLPIERFQSDFNKRDSLWQNKTRINILYDGQNRPYLFYGEEWVNNAWDSSLFTPYTKEAYFLYDTVPSPFSNKVLPYTLNNKHIKVFPNPANHRLNIQINLNNEKAGGFVIYNILGKKMLSQRFNRSFSQVQTEINTSSLPSGTYFLNIETDKGIISKKLQILQQ